MDYQNILLIIGSVILALLWSIIQAISIKNVKIGKLNKIPREKTFLWSMQVNSIWSVSSVIVLLKALMRSWLKNMP